MGIHKTELWQKYKIWKVNSRHLSYQDLPCALRGFVQCHEHLTLPSTVKILTVQLQNIPFSRRIFGTAGLHSSWLPKASVHGRSLKLLDGIDLEMVNINYKRETLWSDKPRLPVDFGDIIWRWTDTALWGQISVRIIIHTHFCDVTNPALSPMIVIRSESPPKLSILSFIHFRAMRWSLRPIFPLIVLSPELRKPIEMTAH